MPIYLVQNITKDKKAKETTEANYLILQDKYNEKCINCWSDEKKHSVFYLIQASNEELIYRMYNQTFGSVPYEITPVNTNLVQALLDSIEKPKTHDESAGLNPKIYNHTSYRAFLTTKTINTRLLQHILGIHKAYQLIALQEKTILDHIKAYKGLEMESEEEGLIASFTSSSQAIDCAVSIQKTLYDTAKLNNLRIGLHAGLPDVNNKVPYGNIIKLARYLCGIADTNQIVISSSIHELYSDDGKNDIMNIHNYVRWLFPCEGEFLIALMDTLTNNFQDPKFKVNDFCVKMMMSKSQLYRQTKAIIVKSINELISEYRLLNSLEILNKTDRNIEQTALDTGFNSVSYFSKCFKNRFGLSPKAFLKELAAT